MQFGFGTGVLTGLRLDTAGTPSVVNLGAFQGVQIEFGGDTKMLYATGQYPLDTARGKVKISGKAKTANINGRMYNELFFGQTLSGGSTKFKWNELATLGTGAASYTVALVSTPMTDQGVFQGRQQYIQVSASPTAGEYTFVASTGVYSFGTISAGLVLKFNYTWTATSGYTITSDNPLMGTTPRFKVVLFDQMAHDTKQTVLTLFACVSNRLTFPTSIDDYVISDLDFDAFEADDGTVFAWSMNEA